eukprot:Protomagalhaensia_sp_Gyna_25__1903@NODE_2008_length_1350_cov_19_659039_g1655_i0_p1_GENE_NODE_2008_length_1350_cov_19_659039_g1655_i0NODE_2008_length_1350_cov_19_659039_g1655_i0_p1_ORF_typecomplete_len282_score46_86Rubissubsbind/PF09273_11/3_7e03Rubissubsbind/PF09273_11/3_1e03Rubissubsbind/PF09273_11/0_46_NODE_2008_length_1350_cov_19_659039_g1655_i0109954
MNEVVAPYEEERTKTIIVLLRCLKFEPIGAEKSITARDTFLRACRQQRVADLCDILLRCMAETVEAVRKHFSHLLPLQGLMGYLVILHMATDAVASYLTTLGQLVGNDGFNNMSDFIRTDQATSLQKLMMDILGCLRDFQRQLQPPGTLALGALTPPMRDTASRNSLCWQGHELSLRMPTSDNLTDQAEIEALQALLDHCRQTLENFYILMTDDGFDTDRGISRGVGRGLWGLVEERQKPPLLMGDSMPEHSSSDGEIFDRVIAMLKQTLFESPSMQPNPC